MIRITSPAPVAEPRGAAWAASAASAVSALFSAAFAWLHLVQHRRIQRELLHDAKLLRAYARQVELHDPRFASDLFSAADRHEQSR